MGQAVTDTKATRIIGKSTPNCHSARSSEENMKSVGEVTTKESNRPGCQAAGCGHQGHRSKYNALPGAALHIRQPNCEGSIRHGAVRAGRSSDWTNLFSSPWKTTSGHGTQWRDVLRGEWGESVGLNQRETKFGWRVGSNDVSAQKTSRAEFVVRNNHNLRSFHIRL